MKTIATRVLPADVYDTLEFVAEAYGGVGRGAWNDYDAEGNAEAPRCIVGMAWFSDPAAHDVIPMTLAESGITEITNDSAFSDDEFRIPFAEWARRLNVVRGA